VYTVIIFASQLLQPLLHCHNSLVELRYHLHTGIFSCGRAHRARRTLLTSSGAIYFLHYTLLYHPISNNSGWSSKPKIAPHLYPCKRLQIGQREWCYVRHSSPPVRFYCYTADAWEAVSPRSTPVYRFVFVVSGDHHQRGSVCGCFVPCYMASIVIIVFGISKISITAVPASSLRCDLHDHRHCRRHHNSHRLPCRPRNYRSGRSNPPSNNH
jgi:hypothetical protein